MSASPSATSVSTFESRRQAIYEQYAQDALARLDPEHHLFPAKRLTQGLHSTAEGFGIRDSAYGMVALAMTGREERAWQVLDAILQYQDTDPASFTCGNFRWHSGWSRVRDPNAASFMVPKLCHVLRHRGEVMPGDLRERLIAALRLAVDGLNAHRAAWEYTNIWLLNTACKLMIGDLLGDTRARDLGYLDWEEWRNWTGRLGAIPEVNCPGYTFVHLDALALMLACDVDEGLKRQVRAVMRHLITSVVLDYHPEIGVVTGPKSRGAILRRGDAGLDTILHFVLGAPEPTVKGFHLWLGAPIGPEDVLPIGRDLSLPRRTHSQTHGFRRFNYLAEDYTIGGFTGKGGFSPQRVPFFIAHRTSAERCTVPIQVSPAKPEEAFFADQEGGAMLAAGTWLVAERDDDRPELQDAWLSRLTGLNCGRPGNLLVAPQPSFEVDLGHAEALRVLTPAGERTLEPDETVALDATTLAVEMERVTIGMRWYCHGGEPTLTLHRDAEGEVRLTVEGLREGIAVSEMEWAVLLGMLIDIRVRATSDDVQAHAAELSAAKLAVNVQSHGWRVTAETGQGRPLSVDVNAQPSWLYGVDDRIVSMNQWARSLSDQG